MQRSSDAGFVLLGPIPFGCWDIDFVAVGPNGIWVIETLAHPDDDLEHWRAAWHAEAYARRLRLRLNLGDVPVRPAVFIASPERQAPSAELDGVHVLSGELLLEDDQLLQANELARATQTVEELRHHRLALTG